MQGRTRTLHVDAAEITVRDRTAGAGPSPDVRALIGYTGPAMTDPTLAGRLGGVDIPVRVLWGASDRIVDPEYGRAYAAPIPGATFTVLPRTGHLPQLETPETLLAHLDGHPV
ncbi:MAG TPA: alpha/beta fold hydrolase [Actinocatenispora sp.]